MKNLLSAALWLAGVSGGLFAQTVQPQTPPNPFCCATTNLITNGTFESGNTGFTSAYLYNASTLANAVLPRQYNVTTSGGALSISPNWIVRDHASCVAGLGNSRFMVVNGRTTQSVGMTSVIWQQTFSTAVRDEYKFCANLKNLNQCTFNMLPHARLEIDNNIGPWVTINMAAGSCNWQLLTNCYTLTAGSHTARIRIKEDSNGDGNDLALDDISVQVKTNPVSISVTHFGNPQQIQGSIFGPGTGDDVYPNFLCGVSFVPVWLIVEWNPAIPGPVGTPTLFTGLSTNFPGVVFQNNKFYMIQFRIKSCCQSCYKDGYAYQITYYGGGQMPPIRQPILSEEEEDYYKNLMDAYEANNPVSRPSSISTDLNDNSAPDNNSGMQIVPNPNDGAFVVKLVEAASGHLEIMDAQGRKVYQQDVTKVSEFSVDLRKESPGAYTVRFTSEKGVFTEKLVKN